MRNHRGAGPVLIGFWWFLRFLPILSRSQKFGFMTSKASESLIKRVNLPNHLIGIWNTHFIEFVNSSTITLVPQLEKQLTFSTFHVRYDVRRAGTMLQDCNFGAAGKAILARAVCHLAPWPPYNVCTLTSVCLKLVFNKDEAFPTMLTYLKLLGLPTFVTLSPKCLYEDSVAMMHYQERSTCIESLNFTAGTCLIFAWVDASSYQLSHKLWNTLFPASKNFGHQSSKTKTFPDSGSFGQCRSGLSSIKQKAIPIGNGIFRNHQKPRFRC